MVAAVGLVLAAEADVERSDAEMLQEGGVVGPRAERADRKVAASLGRVDHVGREFAGASVGCGEDRCTAALRRGNAGARVGDVVRGLGDEMLQFMAA